MGCCVLATTCKRTKREECNNLNGQFFRDFDPLHPTYCSSLQPQCSMCQANDSKTCTDFDVNVHNVDSCGNIEDIDNNCQNKNEVCVDEDGNAHCGGSCTIDNKAHGNGESWCIYDVNPSYYDNLDFSIPENEDTDNPETTNKIPFGVMGSRDFRAICVYGKEIIEPCADYRNQICVQDESAKTAGCIMNMWPECLTIKNKSICEANKHCVWDVNAEYKDGHAWPGYHWGYQGREIWEHASSDDARLQKQHEPFANFSCLPRYPPGFPSTTSAEGCEGLNETECRMNSNCLWNLGECNSSLNLIEGPLVCGSATYVCKVEHNTYGGCRHNCDCETSKFAKAMAKKCSALGDCGMNINIMKKTSTDGFIVTRVYGNDTKVLEDIYADEWKEIFKNYFNSIKRISGFGLGENKGIVSGTKLTTPSSVDFLQAIEKLKESKSEFYDVWEGKFEGSGYNWGGGPLFKWIAGIVATVLGVLAFPYSGPIGAIIAAAIGVAVVWILKTISPWATARTWYYVFECKPASAPLGGDDCEKCNEDPERPCSEYRCKSLGQACILINKGTGEEKCISDLDDGIPPKIIEAKSLTDGYSIQNFQAGPPGGGFTIKGPVSDCFRAWESMMVQMKTNEFAKCGYSFTLNTPYEQMRKFDNGASYHHTLNLKFPNEEQGSGQHTMFIKCQDVFGHTFAVDYPVSFCVEVGPDVSPPVIIGTVPRTGSGFPEGAQTIPLSIIVNEPSQCRWNKQDINYENMGPTTQCDSEPLISGNYKCDTELTDLVPDITNYFYIRCNDTVGNMNQQSYELKLLPTPPLLITSIDPEDDSTIKGCEVAGIILNVTTAEGADDGKATCYWKNTTSIWNEFSKTDSTSHSTEISIFQGLNTIDIKCQDSMSITQNQTTFNVIVDKDAPKITRIYKSGGSLILRTDEPATCSYHYSAGQKISGCNFTADDTLYAKFFDSIGETTHTTAWDNEPWYVKCYDKCGNGNKSSDDCTAIIYPAQVE